MTAAIAQTTAPASNQPGSTSGSIPAPREISPLFEMAQGQWRSSKLIGVDVYNNTNEKIGDIRELILDRNGKVEAVVIGVGGFLGIGEHDAAVPFQNVQFVSNPSAASSGVPNDSVQRGFPDRAIVTMTKEQLKALPQVRYTR